MEDTFPNPQNTTKVIWPPIAIPGQTMLSLESNPAARPQGEDRIAEPVGPHSSGPGEQATAVDPLPGSASNGDPLSGLGTTHRNCPDLVEAAPEPEHGAFPARMAQSKPPAASAGTLPVGPPGGPAGPKRAL
ncbi:MULTISPECIES: hypothetical protein [Streptomyces]|uniref:hypothetical protein n=1 Tax=Streptomyces TaxID=1883 RepID=UPI000A3758FB|nr:MULTISPECIES: hypothetical protein [Streptomyces]MDX3632709.1 hypothetical protein [Streptomyces europaeiscabiei]MDX3653017.1 hypothetical protein [Streptomyces europaeiscabiei]WUD34080.1 hypothetical protein OG858_23530 [Streptomyces europaeiscabiei]